MIRWLPLVALFSLGPCRQSATVPVLPVPLDPGDGRLRLAVTSFNMRYEEPRESDWRNWSTRLPRVLHAIRSMDPDIMGTQEVMHGQAADLRASLPDYAFEGVGRQDGKRAGEYSAIFYRRSRFLRTGGGTFWLSSQPDVPGTADWGNSYTRTATWVRLVDRATGRGFYVFNTHWDHKSQPSREHASRLMARRISARAHPDEPVILTGDLNATENNVAVNYLTGKAVTLAGTREKAWEEALVDTYQALNSGVRNRRTMHFWSARTDGWAKVDHILASRGTRVNASGILRAPARELEPSDHFPVWAQLTIE